MVVALTTRWGKNTQNFTIIRSITSTKLKPKHCGKYFHIVYQNNEINQVKHFVF